MAVAVEVRIKTVEQLELPTREAEAEAELTPARVARVVQVS
jgi:hypothetical protein